MLASETFNRVLRSRNRIDQPTGVRCSVADLLHIPLAVVQEHLCADCSSRHRVSASKGRAVQSLLNVPYSSYRVLG